MPIKNRYIQNALYFRINVSTYRVSKYRVSTYRVCNVCCIKYPVSPYRNHEPIEPMHLTHPFVIILHARCASANHCVFVADHRLACRTVVRAGRRFSQNVRASLPYNCFWILQRFLQHAINALLTLGSDGKVGKARLGKPFARFDAFENPADH